VLAVTTALVTAVAGAVTVGAGPASADASLGAAIADVADAQLSAGHTHEDATGCNFYTGAIGNPDSGCATPGWGSGDWCADFAKYVWREGGAVEDLSSLNSYADSFRTYGINHDTWHTPSGYTPRPGDAIVYPDKNGNGIADHVGIVISSSGGQVTSVEGNSGSGNGVVGKYTQSVGVAWGYTTPVGHGLAKSRDVTGNGWDDVVARNATDHALYVYDGYASGKLASARQLGAGWGAMTSVLTGEFTGDRVNDLIGIQTSGDMYLYTGNGNGTFGAGRVIGTGWGAMRFVVTADFTGEGHNDLVALRTDGVLFEYTGKGNGTFAAPRQLATGWGGQTALLAGDFDNDDHGDLVGRSPEGNLNVYTGHGDAAFKAPVEISHGWQGMTALIPGDFTGDDYTDVLGRTSDGRLLMYPMGHGGSLGAGTALGTGWNNLDLFQS